MMIFFIDLSFNFFHDVSHRFSKDKKKKLAKCLFIELEWDYFYLSRHIISSEVKYLLLNWITLRKESSGSMKIPKNKGFF